MSLITHIISDPGSDYTQVNSYLNIKHRIGMVDRPQGNVIERDVAEVKRFLKSIANHHDLQSEWSRPRVMMLAEFVINHDVHKPSAFNQKFRMLMCLVLMDVGFPLIIMDMVDILSWLRSTGIDG